MVTTAGKEPFGKQWGIKPIDEKTLAKDVAYFANQGFVPGVGVCLGPGRAPDDGDLVDIEGDGPEAEASRLKLFGGKLFETIGWGSTRGGHQLRRGNGDRLKEVTAKLKRFQVKDANQPGVFHVPSLPGLELRLGGFKPDGTVKQLQSVVPPTPGTDGKPRKWGNGKTLADLPEAFYATLEQIANETEATSEPRPAEPPKSKPKGLILVATNDADDYLRTTLANEVNRIESTGDGARRDKYRNVAYNLAGWLHYHEQYGVGYSEAELASTLKAARAIGVPVGCPVVEATVDEAIAAGKLAPRDLKPDLHESALRFGRARTRSGSNGTPPNDPPAVEVAT